MCANPCNLVFFLKRLGCAGCTISIRRCFHTNYVWSTGSGDCLASPNPIPFFQLQLLCLGRPLSLPSNPLLLPFRESPAVVHGPACASYEITIRRHFSSRGPASALVARRSLHSSITGCSQLYMRLVIHEHVAAKTVVVYTYIQPLHSAHCEKWDRCNQDRYGADRQTDRQIDGKAYPERRFRLPTNIQGLANALPQLLSPHGHLSTFLLGAISPLQWRIQSFVHSQ